VGAYALPAAARGPLARFRAFHSGPPNEAAFSVRQSGTHQSGCPRKNAIKTMHNIMFVVIAGLQFPAGVKECR
jgi:hypothetical protein